MKSKYFSYLIVSSTFWASINFKEAQTIGVNFLTNYTFYIVSQEFKPNAFVPGVGNGLTYRKALSDK